MTGHDHTGEAQAYCIVCDHDHIRNIPRSSWRCRQCGFGSWLNITAQEHLKHCPGHEVHEVEHIFLDKARLTEHDTKVKAQALREFSDILRARYPEDVFRPMSNADHGSVNDAIAGRIERTHVTRDRVSADMMRRAAEQAADYADEIEMAVES